MAVYPKGNKFMASVGSGPTRARRTFRTEPEAQAWERAEEARLEASRALPEPPAPALPDCWTIQQAFDHVLRHKWRGTPGEAKTVINANQAVTFFGPDTPTSAITATWILEWMEELQDEHENSGATCNKKLSALNVMLKAAEEFGGLKALPRTKRYKESMHRIRWFSDAEESAMLAMATQMGLSTLREFITVGIDTGFRKSELLRLTTADYSRGMLTAHYTKNGHSRSVPCTDRVKVIVLSRMAAGGGKLFDFTEPRLRKQWADMRELMGKAEDPGFIIHVMRHTCATRLVFSGVPLNEVQAWMGHKVIQTTMRYAHLMPGALTRAVGMLQARQPEMETQ